MDDFFRDKLNQMRFDVPEDFLADLNQRLDASASNQSKRRKGFFFYIIGALVVLLAGVLLFNEYSSKEISSRNRAPLAEKSGKTGKTTRSSAEVIGEDISDVQHKTKTNTIKNNSGDNTKHLFASDSDLLSDMTPKQRKNPEKWQNDTPQGNGPKTYSIGPETSTNISNTNTKEQAAVQVDPEVVGEARQTKVNEIAIEKEHVSKSVEEEYVAAISDSESITDEVTEESSIDDQALVTSKMSNSKRLNVLLQVGGGFSLSNPVIRSTGSLEPNSELLGKTLWSPAVELGLSMQYGSLVAGINPIYTQVGERLSFELHSTQLVDSIYQNGSIWQEVWNEQTLQWDSLEVPNYDTTQINSSVKSTLTHRNAYSRIQIPVKFGYAFGWRSWTLIPSAGVVFDIALNNGKGTYPNESGNDVMYLKPESMVLSYSLETELRRNFGPWHAFIRPRFSSMFSPLIETENSSRKYNQWSVMIGIGYSLR